MTTSRRTDLPVQTRLAPIAGVNAEKRTADLVWSTGARVKRYDWERSRYYMEELSMKPGHVRLGRMNAGAPLLNTHSRYSLEDVLGVVEPGTASVDGIEGRATVRFSEREDVQPIFADVKSGIIRNVSAGYVTHRMEMLPPDATSDGLAVYRAIDWEPMEVSLVPIGADAGAGVRSEEQQRVFPCEFIEAEREAGLESPPAVSANQRKETSDMNPEEQKLAAEAEAAKKRTEEATARAVEVARTAELARVQTIRSLCATHKLERAFEDGMIGDATVTEHVARERVLAKLAEKTESTEIRSGFGDVVTVSDETVNRRAAMVNSLLHRANPGAIKLDDAARPYRGFTLRELMRKCLELRGVRTDGMTPNQMWERTYLSGSDLPAIVLDAANKSLRAGYESSPRSFVPWTRRNTAPDFKNINRIQLSGGPALLEVKSGGEFTRGNVSDGKEVYALTTYGRVLGINRQTIINDDLSAFTRLPEMAARACADLESDTVYGIVTANGTLQTTGFALFGTGHVNLTTGATPTISVDALGVGRAKIRVQTGLEGRPINAQARFLIVPAALESIAEQFTSQAYVAAQSSNINPFAAGGRNALTPIVEPRLDPNSAAAWYMAADPMQVDTIEYSYLEGEEGPYMETRQGFDVDGIELKVRLDFAAKALDYRGLYKRAGS